MWSKAARGDCMGRWGYLVLMLLVPLAGGCAGRHDYFEPSPILAGGSQVVYDQNPVFIPLGPESYGQVFESCLRVLGDYGFEIQESNRYDGRIECLPRVAPGLLLLLKPGSPDLRDRVLMTAQSYRHRLSLTIQLATNGGYFIVGTARQEL